MKNEAQIEWEARVSKMTNEEIEDAIRNKLPKDKTPILRKIFVKEYIKRYKKASETK